MRIAVLPSWYPSESEPLKGVFIQEQAAVLATRHDVVVIVPKLARPLPGSPMRFSDSVEDGVRVLRVGVRAAFPGVGRALSSWKSAARAGLERLNDEGWRPDVLHAHVTLPAGWAATDIGSAPVVLTEHVSVFDPPSISPDRQSEIRSALLGSRVVLAVSPHLSEAITAFEPAAEVRVVPDLVRTSFFTPAQPAVDGVFSFLLVGGLVERKGVADLLEATRILAGSTDRPFRVIVAGDGPLRLELEDAARGLPVTFEGAVPRERVRFLIRDADAVVSASTHESFCVVLGEAMSCGKPVLATRSGGPEYVVSEGCGVLVPVSDPPAMAAAMSEIFEAEWDPELIRNEAISRFGEDVFLAAMDQVYRSVVN